MRHLTRETTPWQKFLYEDAKEDSLDLTAIECKGDESFDGWPDFMREAFARAYAPDVPVLDTPDTTTPWATKAHGLIDELPDARRLFDRTRGDEFASSVAATSLGQAVLDSLPAQAGRKDARSLAEAVSDLEEVQAEGGDVEHLLDEARKAAQIAQDALDGTAEGLDPRALRQAVRKACEATQEKLDDIDAQVRSFTAGSDPGSAGLAGNAKTKAALASRLGISPKLREIARLAGRFRNIAAKKQRTRSTYARTELVGIEVGRDLARVLPSQLALLFDDDTEDLFFKRYVDRTLLQYDMAGRDKRGRGPIVFCLDESSSMSGERDVWAKAVFLAIMEIARRQNRTAALVHFSKTVARVDEFKPRQTKLEDVLAACDFFAGGGTDFVQPCEAAKALIEGEGFKDADVIFVTDGEASAPGSWWDDFRRKEGVTCYGVAVGGTGRTRILDLMCDEVIHVSTLAAQTADERQITDTLFAI